MEKMKMNFLFICISLTIFVGAINAAPSGLNYRPIIGVLTEPINESAPEQGSFLPASYVKWLESAGARVAPVPYDGSSETLMEYFQSLNGILFPGGGLSLKSHTTFYKTAKFFFDQSIAAYKKGDYFPIWGTCMGFQLLTILGADDHSVLEEYAFDSENLPLPLEFTSGFSSSRLFKDAPAAVIHTYRTKNVTMNLHHDGVDPSQYAKNAKLSGLYNLISTNVDRKGKPFGSTLEGKVFPIYAVQWHPERNQFEWDVEENLDKTHSSMVAVQYLVNFFVQEARKSNHRFGTPAAEKAALIYQYHPTYTGDDTSENFPDQQTYYFNLPTPPAAN